MGEQRKQLLKLLKLLDDNGYSDHLILIGSWAEYLYTAAEILPGYEAVIRTLDIDFLVKNLKRPTPPVNITQMAKEEGFYVEEDRLTGVSKLLSRTGLEVEFLIAKKGKGIEPALKTNLGVTAQALRNLEVLKSHALDIEFMGIKVTVPEPEAFVIHKMIINRERRNKREKDQAVINRMCRHLDEEKFNSITATLTKKQQKAVREYIREHIAPLVEKEKTLEKAKEQIKE